MSRTSWREEVERRVLAPQIIAVVVFEGSVAFLAVALVLVHLNHLEPNRNVAGVMDLVLIVLLIGDLAARLVVPGILVARSRRKIAAGTWSPPNHGGASDLAAFIERTGDAGRLLFVYQTRTILCCGLLDGVVFFAIVVYMLTQSMLGLVVAVVSILALAFHIPTRSGVSHWIEDQLLHIEQER
jgi:hypothetical protein